MRLLIRFKGAFLIFPMEPAAPLKNQRLHFGINIIML